MSVTARPSVLLATEGTYPHHRGGVSTWGHALTRQLHQVDFTIFAVTVHPYLRQCYELSPNVRQVVTVPLWGTRDPAEFRSGLTYGDFVTRRAAATSEAARSVFLAAHDQFLQSALRRDAQSLDQCAEATVAMHGHFTRNDYRGSFADPRVWHSFVDLASRAWRSEQPERPSPALAELADAWRLLSRFLVILDSDIPICDLTHSAAAALCGLPCIVAKLTRGTPYLLTEHGVYLKEQYLNLGNTIDSPFVRWFVFRVLSVVVDLNYRHADLVTPVCRYNTRWERWRGVPDERIRVIYNGVDPARFRPAPPARNERPTVASVGLIYPLKGQIDLIEAAALVRRDVPNVKFQLYGSASDEEYYSQCRAQVERLGLEKTVVFAGPTSQPWEVYQGADVVALASISEAFPYVLVEAMLSRRAVVATDVGGVSEALGNAGVLVRPRDPTSLAAGITSLLRSPEHREQLADRGCTRATTMFTEEVFVNAYRETYASLIALGIARTGECGTPLQVPSSRRRGSSFHRAPRQTTQPYVQIEETLRDEPFVNLVSMK